MRAAESPKSPEQIAQGFFHELGGYAAWYAVSLWLPGEFGLFNYGAEPEE